MQLKTVQARSRPERGFGEESHHSQQGCDVCKLAKT